VSVQAYTGSGGLEIGKVDDMFGIVASLTDEWYELKFGYNAGELDTGAGGHGGEEEEEEEEEGHGPSIFGLIEGSDDITVFTITIDLVF
jgi:hypothetical protein